MFVSQKCIVAPHTPHHRCRRRLIRRRLPVMPGGAPCPKIGYLQVSAADFDMHDSQ
jgi:hypothetical protein